MGNGLSKIYNSYLFRAMVFFQYHRMCSKWGIEIPRVENIDTGLYIEHHGGVVVSSQTKIGKNVNLSQGVIIGISGKGDRRGVPVIGNNVYTAPGAKVLGKITIGNNVSIDS
ncbi:hypothetical protein [Pseudoalteromonas fuliginea]|uniref:hypothetical protein n=1 Tax=Pseudoalteromonas fuliginea TaxID=1872678 RepID=UPI00067D92D1|nr:hypothetical protein [Pseudoalteromonas fuliginea]